MALTKEWQKATAPGQGGNCLEARFKKATASGQGGDCVEVAHVEGTVQVRDSKDREGAVLEFTEAEWTAFLDGVWKGEFELPVASA